MNTDLSRSAILFDLDGTLVDSVADLAVSANATLARYGLSPLSEERVASYIGDGARKLLERCLGTSHGAVDVDEALRRFRDHYLDQCTEFTRPYPGVVEGLRTFSERPMAIVTNKPEPMADRIADALELRPHLAAVVGARPRIPVKPDPALLVDAVERIESTGARVDRATSWMVGDSANDVLAGRALGMQTIAVTWGFTPREKLEDLGADHIVDSFEHVTRLLSAS